MRTVSLSISTLAICLLIAVVVLAQNGTPPSVTTAPSFLYTPNIADNTISAYAIDSTTGSLTPIAGSPFAAVNSELMTLDSDGNFAYVGGGSFSVISTFAIDSQTGFLTVVNTLAQETTYGVTGLTLAPKDRFAYVANTLGVVGYEVDKKSGFLTDIAQPQINAGGDVIRGAVDPSGKFAYFAAPDLNGAVAYTLNPGNGTLTPIPGSPFSTGNRPVDLAVEPCGQFLYATNLFSNDVSGYAIDKHTGSLTAVPGSPFAAQNQPIGIAIDPGGHFVFAVNRFSDNVSVYAIDRSTGSLGEVSGSPFATGLNPVAVGLDPSGTFVYVANTAVLPTNVSTVSGFTLDPTTGALTPVPGSPFVSGRNPNGIAITGQRRACKQNSVDD
jgi:6-phosphogluconolactonase (cycloisomerase 2 family)